MPNGYTPNSASYRSKPVKKRIPAQTADQYVVTIGSKEIFKQFFGKLRIVRATDHRVIYPYDGAEDIGPFPLKALALAATEIAARKFVEADLANPE